MSNKIFSRRQLLIGLAGSCVFPADLFAAAPAGSQTSNNTSNFSNIKTSAKATFPFTVKATSFNSSPANPYGGQTVTLTFQFQTSGPGKKSLPWQIICGGSVIASGIKHNVEGGKTVQVSATWPATEGGNVLRAEVDPTNTLKESSSQFNNNKKFRTIDVLPTPNWSAWGNAAWDATKTAINLWQTQAQFRNISVNAITATGGPGCLKGPDLKTQLKSSMLTQNLPSDIADKWASAVSEAWKLWQDFVTVPSLPWYPTFAAFPGKNAPPTANVPTPLITLVSSKIAEFEPNTLKARIKNKLGIAANQPGADAAITQYVTKTSTAFGVWLASQQVMLVMGKGPVPSFNPPLVPVGPVVRGSANSAPGNLSTNSPFGAPY